MHNNAVFLQLSTECALVQTQIYKKSILMSAINASVYYIPTDGKIGICNG